MAWELTALWATRTTFALAHCIASGHELLTIAPRLEWREDEDAGQIVVVPTELFLTEEADDLIVFNKEVVDKATDIEAN